MMTLTAVVLPFLLCISILSQGYLTEASGIADELQKIQGGFSGRAGIAQPIDDKIARSRRAADELQKNRGEFSGRAGIAQPIDDKIARSRRAADDLQKIRGGFSGIAG
ncbi:uncharacterized protein LOC117342956 [Pecten maximus]|uniref:uncharacterized protein LOC117342956 n=1 Tax=Pecten maximus TaxID=6579 RepID=UPI0014587192|nr:uncharacterized protein LOC117342956 [Pecten maximus]